MIEDGVRDDASRSDYHRLTDLLQQFDKSQISADAFRAEVRSLSDADLRRLSTILVEKHRAMVEKQRGCGAGKGETHRFWNFLGLRG